MSELTYDAHYAANTRETFRRQVLHQFVQACVAEYNAFDPALPTNRPARRTTLSPRTRSQPCSASARQAGNAQCETFGAARSSSRSCQRGSQGSHHMVPVTTPSGLHLQLSPGRHNAVPKSRRRAVCAPFRAGSRLLYLGDTARKALIVDDARLADLGIAITEHDKLPDILIYDELGTGCFSLKRSHPTDPFRTSASSNWRPLLTECSCRACLCDGVSDFAEFRKHMMNIAWETEVWLCDAPDHMIHYDGDRFLGPRAE